MNKLFAEGGLNTGDAATDPVSGNEVPPGSMPEEVRDDIDAKLSGGEYVVPADVLRFYGVAFFEKLRKKAKDGLAEMDADGRIGGGGDPEQEDDFPFSEDELMTADEEDDMEFAEGGAVPFNPNQYMFGGQQIPFGQATTQTNQTAPSGMETKTYVNAQGQTMQVLFINGQPAAPIPAGFSPQGSTPATPATPATTPAKPAEVKTPGSEERRNAGMTGREQKGNSETGRTWDPGVNFKDPAAVEKYVSGELNQANRYGQVGSGVGQLLAGPIGGVLAGMGTAGTQVSNARAAAIIARAQGNVELADKLDTQINSYVDSKGLGGKFVLNAIASGELKAKRYLASQGAATTGDPLTRATAVSAASKNPGTGNVIATKTKDDRGTGPAKTGANKDTKSPSGSVSFSAAKDKPASKPAPSKDKPKSGGNFKGGRATGGLVQRRK